MPARWMTIHLGCALPRTSCSQPGQRSGKREPQGVNLACRPYLALLPVGFAVPSALPRPRCALTAPFHPCPGPEGPGRFAFCGTFPGVASAGRYPAPCFRGARTFLTGAGNRQPARSSSRLVSWKSIYHATLAQIQYSAASTMHWRLPDPCRHESDKLSPCSRRNRKVLQVVEDLPVCAQKNWKLPNVNNASRSLDPVSLGRRRSNIQCRLREAFSERRRP